MNQALQYDSGKYYYIEDCPGKDDEDWDDWVRDSKIKSTRIEVAPESAELIHKLLYRHNFGKKVTLPTDGIYPVQVKVEIVKRAVYTRPEYSFGEAKAKQYAILSEPDKDLSVTVSGGFEPTNNVTENELWTKVINDARWYDGSPNDLVALIAHFKKQGISVIQINPQ